MHIHGSLLPRVLREPAVFLVLAVAAAMLPAIALTAPAQAASGDFSLNLAAAAPYSYHHLQGGGAFDDATKGVNADIVESLEAGDFACGDTVTFLTQVTVADTAQAGTDGPQTIDIDYQFLMDTTGASGAAIGDITRVAVNYPPVVDTITGEDPVDQGITDDGGSTATLLSETPSGPLFQAGSVLDGTVRVTDLERAEKVVVRVDVRLLCKPGGRPTGNLQAAVTGARLTFIKGAVPVSPAANIGVGNQTVPFKQFGNLHIPELVIAKTVTTANGTCPGTESLAIQSGDTVKYCYRVTNPSDVTQAPGAALYDVTSVTDDNRTPGNPADDFAVALTGLSDVDGDGQSDDLAAGGQAFGEQLVQVTAGQSGTYTNTAGVEGYQFPGDTALPFTASDTASVVVTVPVGPSINISKTPGTVSGPDDHGDFTVGYTVAVTNGGTSAGTYGPITDTPQFDAHLVPTAVSWRPAGSGAWTTDTAAPYHLGAAGTMIAAGTTDSYDVTVTFHYTGTTAASVCDGTVDHGLYNEVTVPTGQEQGTPTDNDACLDPPAPPTASISIKKSADLSAAAPGDTVTYKLVVKNTGSGAANDVTVTDQLPTGVTFVSATAPCVESGGTVTCALGTLAAGSTVTLLVEVEVDPLPAGDTGHQHQLGYTKVEANLAVLGGTGTASASCPTGYFATDGSVRVDHVDQGTGTLAEVAVLASHATADGSGWTGTIRNDTTGQAQAKVNVVCMGTTTVSGDEHVHVVDVSVPVTTSASFSAGRHRVDRTCAAGHYPITPGFTFTSGDGVVSTELTTTGWAFFVDTAGPATADVEIRCLGADLEPADGHTHHLTFTQVTDTLTVPSGLTAEAKLTCPDGYKGIVAWSDIDPGLVPLGTDPQPITRVYRFYNPTGSDLQARIGLLCAPIRTDGGDTGPVTITNTADVTTTSSDADPSDNSASAGIQVTATGVALAPTALVSRAGNRTLVTLSVFASRSRAVSFKLLAAGKVRGVRLEAGSVLAAGAAEVRRGHHQVRIVATGAAAQALRSGTIHRAKLVVVTRTGARDARIIRLRH